MAASEENSALFPIFILTIMAIPLVPYTMVKLSGALSKKQRTIHCQCLECDRSGKYKRSLFKKISNFSTWSNLTLVLLWVVMIFLIYYTKNMSREAQVFDPFSILGLEPGVTDSEIKKAYRRLSIQYHPDKNPDPEANKYFVEFISKAYQALTDSVSRENFEKYGHPDGRQGFQMGIALPQFLLDIDGASGGILLLWIVGVCILLPLVIAVIYLSRSSKYTGNYVMHQTLSAYYYLMKPSLAPSKVMEVFTKAAEYMEIPVRRTDDEPLQKLFMSVRSELNLDLKNMKQEQAKFWKQHPAIVKTELLIQAQLTRESGVLSPALQGDFRRVLELAPRLLEELLKMAVIPRTAQGHGWLRPAVGVVELSQCIVQAVPLSARKSSGVSSEGISPFLQLPHFSDAVVKKIARKKVKSFQDLQEMRLEDRSELLTQVAGLSATDVEDIEKVLEMMPSITVDITCETEGEEGIQEGDIVTLQAWVTLKRPNGLVGALPHAPYFPFHKEENYWVLLADSVSNNVWFSQKVSFLDEGGAITAASKAISESMEGSGAGVKETNDAVREAIEKVKFTYGLLLGMGSAVETLCGQAHGAHRYEMLGVYLQRSTVVLILTCLPMSFLFLFSNPILTALGEPEQVATLASVFVYGMIPVIFAYAVNFPIQKFLQSQSIVTPSAYISAATLVIHLILSWIAVYRLGYGLLALSLIHSFSWWIIVVAQIVYIKMSPRCRRTWEGFSWKAFEGLWDFFRLSAASAVMLCLESWYSQILVLLAGLLKNPELALDSLAICMSISAISFMVSVGFNAAASVRVSNELGAGNPRAAAFSTVVTTGVSFLLSVFEAIVVLSWRHVISYAFTDSPAVAEAVADLSPFLAITIVLNGIQPVLSGVAVGCGWQAFVAYVNIGCYYVVGIPVGFVLGFTYDMGAKGIWTGMIGGTLMQTIILVIVTLRTDWDKEVEKASSRLDQWEESREPLLKQ